MLALALLSLLAQTPAHARYLFELDGAPVGTVELSVDGTDYTYTSVHVYRRTRGQRREVVTLAPGGPAPEGYWLWHQMRPGCVSGVAELSHETGPLCAEQVRGHEVKGTTLGRPFVARYDSAGELQELRVGKSRFVRTARALEPGAPYAKGFAVRGKGSRLELEPAITGLRSPVLTPSGTRTTSVAEADSCLELATAYVAQHAGSRLALGVVLEQGRGYPHAWVVSPAGDDLDPSAKVEPGPPAPNHTYLELPRESAGELYLDLLEGRRSLTWK